MRIAHIADIHIRNYKYHKEYKAAFEDLYVKLREQRVDLICLLGDIAHTKTDISPEFVKMTSDLFIELGKIAPTKIILGNHDLNCKAKARLDAITPIVDALNDKNIELWKYSGIRKCGSYLNNDKTVLPVNFNVFSILDPENWTRPESGAINIALYHGSISGCTVDNGWVMENGDNNVECFEGHDLVLLGDIHKRQNMDKEGRIAYPGSLIQQNFAEDREKGFLVWNINSKDNIVSEFVPVKNIRPFINVSVENKALKCAKEDIRGARVRLVVNELLTTKETQDLLSEIREQLPESVVIQNNVGKLTGILDAEGRKIEKDDLAGTGVQNKFLEEFLSAHDVGDEKVQAVLELNKKYNHLVASSSPTTEQIQWDIDKIEWNNFFNYGENNEINFEDLNGIIGIFGKSYSGKSSVIDTLLFTIFNNSTKNVRKNINYINSDKDRADAKVHLKIDGQSFAVERKLEKYKKSGKPEAKSDVHFANVTSGEVLNQLDKKETDRQIQKVFGRFEDFLLTSVSSQLGSLSFINEGTTKRREVLSRFLGLDVFSKINDLVKVETRDLKGALKKASLEEVENKINKSKEELKDTKKDCKKIKISIDKQKGLIHEIKEAIAEASEAISNISILGIDIVELKDRHEFLLLHSDNVRQEIEDKQSKIDEYNLKLEKIEKFIEVYDYQGFLEKRETYEKIEKEIAGLLEEERRIRRDIEVDQEKIKILDSVPCKECEEFAGCRFIVGAVDSKKGVSKKLKAEEQARAKLAAFESVRGGEDFKKETERAEKYKKCELLEKELLVKILRLNAEIQECKTSVNKTNDELDEIDDKKARYYKDIENETRARELRELLEKKGCHLVSMERRLEESNKDYEGASRREAAIYGILGVLLEEEKQIKKLQADYEVYDLYLKATSSNGIPFAILKNNLSLINEQINNVLANVVDFKAYFATDDNRLEILLEHPGSELRPIELGSGAEKTLVSIAVRIAMTSFSNLPRANFFILDEPGTALDAENLRAFDRILDLLRQQFRFTLLITHISEMKDSVDKIIEVNKNNKYAYIKA